MYSQKEFRENLEAANSIKIITSIYQEIAALRMKQLKDGVTQTREFLQGVEEIYNRAKLAYISAIRRQSTGKSKKDWRNLSFIKRNGKTVFVLLSANEHLYGQILLDVWNKFLHDITREKGVQDLAVVGSFGRYLVNNEKDLTAQATFFELNDDKPGEQEIEKIINFINKYERIIVYYGQMVSILNQNVGIEDISGGTTLEDTRLGGKNYLFEPSPEKILEFFETEIIAALFNQKVFDHQLARFAARMVAMDQATQNAEEIIKKLEKQSITLKKRYLNRKQLEVFAGFKMWSEEEK